MIRCNNCGCLSDEYYDGNKCPVCKSTDCCDYYLAEIKAINPDENFVNAMMELREKDPIEFQIKVKQLGILTIADRKNYANRNKQDTRPKCPKCGSTAITTGSRGVNFTFGLIGASKTVNRCSNCGHTWKPKK